jgi:hypothetical protein
MAVDAMRVADALIASDLSEVEYERHLQRPYVLLHSIVENLEDALYRNEKFDQSHRNSDLAIARQLAYPWGEDAAERRVSVARGSFRAAAA